MPGKPSKGGCRMHVERRGHEFGMGHRERPNALGDTYRVARSDQIRHSCVGSLELRTIAKSQWKDSHKVSNHLARAHALKKRSNLNNSAIMVYCVALVLGAGPKDWVGDPEW